MVMESSSYSLGDNIDLSQFCTTLPTNSASGSSTEVQIPFYQLITTSAGNNLVPIGTPVTRSGINNSSPYTFAPGNSYSIHTSISNKCDTNPSRPSDSIGLDGGPYLKNPKYQRNLQLLRNTSLSQDSNSVVPPIVGPSAPDNSSPVDYKTVSASSKQPKSKRKAAVNSGAKSHSNVAYHRGYNVAYKLSLIHI